MKKCSKCHKEKPNSDFSNDKTKNDGIYSSCKECCSIRYKRYKELNKLDVKKREKNYYIKNKEKL